jgi:hypothetical protein
MLLLSLAAFGLLSLVVYDHDTIGYYGTIGAGITPWGILASTGRFTVCIMCTVG